MTAATTTAETFEHEHDADCRPCNRDTCHHLDCQHEGDEGECNLPGCECTQWLADGDCPGEADFPQVGLVQCNGRGYFAVDDDRGNEQHVVCDLCHGTGTFYDRHTERPAS